MPEPMGEELDARTCTPPRTIVAVLAGDLGGALVAGNRFCAAHGWNRACPKYVEQIDRELQELSACPSR